MHHREKEDSKFDQRERTQAVVGLRTEPQKLRRHQFTQPSRNYAQARRRSRCRRLASFHSTSPRALRTGSNHRAARTLLTFRGPDLFRKMVVPVVLAKIAAAAAVVVTPGARPLTLALTYGSKVWIRTHFGPE